MFLRPVLLLVPLAAVLVRGRPRMGWSDGVARRMNEGGDGDGSGGGEDLADGSREERQEVWELQEAQRRRMQEGGTKAEERTGQVMRVAWTPRRKEGDWNEGRRRGGYEDGSKVTSGVEEGWNEEARRERHVDRSKGTSGMGKDWNEEGRRERYVGRSKLTSGIGRDWDGEGRRRRRHVDGSKGTSGSGEDWNEERKREGDVNRSRGTFGIRKERNIRGGRRRNVQSWNKRRTRRRKRARNEDLGERERRKATGRRRDVTNWNKKPRNSRTRARNEDLGEGATKGNPTNLTWRKVTVRVEEEAKERPEENQSERVGELPDESKDLKTKAENDEELRRRMGWRGNNNNTSERLGMMSRSEGVRMKNDKVEEIGWKKENLWARELGNDGKGYGEGKSNDNMVNIKQGVGVKNDKVEDMGWEKEDLWARERVNEGKGYGEETSDNNMVNARRKLGLKNDTVQEMGWQKENMWTRNLGNSGKGYGAGKNDTSVVNNRQRGGIKNATVEEMGWQKENMWARGRGNFGKGYEAGQSKNIGVNNRQRRGMKNATVEEMGWEKENMWTKESRKGGKAYEPVKRTTNMLTGRKEENAGKRNQNQGDKKTEEKDEILVINEELRENTKREGEAEVEKVWTRNMTGRIRRENSQNTPKRPINERMVKAGFQTNVRKQRTQIRKVKKGEEKIKKGQTGRRERGDEEERANVINGLAINTGRTINHEGGSELKLNGKRSEEKERKRIIGGEREIEEDDEEEEEKGTERVSKGRRERLNKGGLMGVKTGDIVREDDRARKERMGRGAGGVVELTEDSESLGIRAEAENGKEGVEQIGDTSETKDRNINAISWSVPDMSNDKGQWIEDEKKEDKKKKQEEIKLATKALKLLGKKSDEKEHTRKQNKTEEETKEAAKAALKILGVKGTKKETEKKGQEDSEDKKEKEKLALGVLKLLKEQEEERKEKEAKKKLKKIIKQVDKTKKKEEKKNGKGEAHEREVSETPKAEKGNNATKVEEKETRKQNKTKKKDEKEEKKEETKSEKAEGKEKKTKEKKEKADKAKKERKKKERRKCKRRTKKKDKGTKEDKTETKNKAKESKKGKVEEQKDAKRNNTTPAAKKEKEGKNKEAKEKKTSANSEKKKSEDEVDDEEVMIQEMSRQFEMEDRGEEGQGEERGVVERSGRLQEEENDISPSEEKEERALQLLKKRRMHTKNTYGREEKERSRGQLKDKITQNKRDRSNMNERRKKETETMKEHGLKDRGIRNERVGLKRNEITEREKEEVSEKMKSEVNEMNEDRNNMGERGVKEKEVNDARVGLNMNGNMERGKEEARAEMQKKNEMEENEKNNMIASLFGSWYSGEKKEEAVIEKGRNRDEERGEKGNKNEAQPHFFGITQMKKVKQKGETGAPQTPGMGTDEEMRHRSRDKGKMSGGLNEEKILKEIKKELEKKLKRKQRRKEMEKRRQQNREEKILKEIKKLEEKVESNEREKENTVKRKRNETKKEKRGTWENKKETEEKLLKEIKKEVQKRLQKEERREGMIQGNGHETAAEKGRRRAQRQLRNDKKTLDGINENEEKNMEAKEKKDDIRDIKNALVSILGKVEDKAGEGEENGTSNGREEKNKTAPKDEYENNVTRQFEERHFGQSRENTEGSEEGREANATREQEKKEELAQDLFLMFKEAQVKKEGAEAGGMSKVEELRSPQTKESEATSKTWEELKREMQTKGRGEKRENLAGRAEELRSPQRKESEVANKTWEEVKREMETRETENKPETSTWKGANKHPEKGESKPIELEEKENRKPKESENKENQDKPKEAGESNTKAGTEIGLAGTTLRGTRDNHEEEEKVHNPFPSGQISTSNSSSPVYLQPTWESSLSLFGVKTASHVTVKYLNDSGDTSVTIHIQRPLPASKNMNETPAGLGKEADPGEALLEVNGPGVITDIVANENVRLSPDAWTWFSVFRRDKVFAVYRAGEKLPVLVYAAPLYSNITFRDLPLVQVWSKGAAEWDLRGDLYEGENGAREPKDRAIRRELTDLREGLLSRLGVAAVLRSYGWRAEEDDSRLMPYGDLRESLMALRPLKTLLVYFGRAGSIRESWHDEAKVKQFSLHRNITPILY